MVKLKLLPTQIFTIIFLHSSHKFIWFLAKCFTEFSKKKVELVHLKLFLRNFTTFFIYLKIALIHIDKQCWLKCIVIVHCFFCFVFYDSVGHTKSQIFPSPTLCTTVQNNSCPLDIQPELKLTHWLRDRQCAFLHEAHSFRMNDESKITETKEKSYIISHNNT